jgi:Na+-transporting NADH:ubiquinone oxidoreductase subunit NqrB
VPFKKLKGRKDWRLSKKEKVMASGCIVLLLTVTQPCLLNPRACGRGFLFIFSVFSFLLKKPAWAVVRDKIENCGAAQVYS